jgi:hypothetical protein
MFRIDHKDIIATCLKKDLSSKGKLIHLKDFIYTDSIQLVTKEWDRLGQDDFNQRRLLKIVHN